jgi:dihydroflavonol-4-reductase
VAIDGGHVSYGRPFTTHDWTRVDDPRVNAYGKSKTLAEQQAWELVKSEGAQEKLAVINPGTILGPLLDDDPGTSVAIIQRLLKGEMPMIPNLILPYVDVRDVADAHVAAMTAPDAGGKRHIVANAGVPLPDVARMLREGVPERADRERMRRSLTPPAEQAAVSGTITRIAATCAATTCLRRRAVPTVAVRDGGQAAMPK